MSSLPITTTLFSSNPNSFNKLSTVYPSSSKNSTSISKKAGISGNLSISKSYLFNGDKYILLCECNSEKEFRSETEKIYNILTENYGNEEQVSHLKKNLEEDQKKKKKQD